MPHEVIMPALGMAQDSGLIVAWHKAPGDAVATGDKLFEVETDKATMEVEAQAGGFLNEVRRGAGDEVPVGEVIAVIGDEADTVHGQTEAAEEIAEGASGPGVAVPDGAEVIMPALGMAQDSGVIVEWRKGPGEAVTAGDILFEVETDKSTIEVEAMHDGYLGALLAEVGDEVPVGDVIAVLTEEKPAEPVRSSRSGKRPAAPGPTEVPRSEPGLAEPPPKRPAASAVAGEGGRILISPKARRLALERGLDLKRLVEKGVSQPFHVSDLDKLASPRDQAGAEPAPTRHLSARVPAGSFSALREKAGGSGVDPGAIYAAFAAASLREAQADETIVVRVDEPVPGKSTFFADPDLIPLSAIAPIDAGRERIVLRDLTDSRISEVALASADAPSLTMTRDGNDFRLTLDFAAAQLSTDAALRLIEGVAARLDEPLRHLL